MSAFTDSPEDLMTKAREWEPAEHRPADTRRLIEALVYELGKSRHHHAGSSSIIREVELAYGSLEAKSAQLTVELAATREELAFYRLPLGARIKVAIVVWLNGLVHGAKRLLAGR